MSVSVGDLVAASTNGTVERGRVTRDPYVAGGRLGANGVLLFHWDPLDGRTRYIFRVCDEGITWIRGHDQAAIDALTVAWALSS